MQAARNIHNLTLVGFMGTGKSSVGRIIADQLHYRFVDTDELIEAQQDTTIAEIFGKQGEAVFRQCEAKAVQELAAQTGLIISTGGGVVINPDNLASLKTHSLVACLWATPETIWERVKEQTHRPLLQTADPLGKIRELLAQRAPFYRQADVLINTGLRSPREVAQQVLHQFQLARARRS